MDVDVFEGGWEHFADDNSANSNSSGGGSSNVLSPSLQSYLDANDPSWVGGNGGSGGGSGYLPPQRQRDPTAIYRAEIARIGRRFGFNNRVSGGRNSRTSSHSVDRRSARSAAILYHQRVRAPPYATSAHDGTFVYDSSTNRNKKWQGIAPHRTYQLEGFLGQGLDGGVALTGSRRLGRRSDRRSIGLAPHSTENASIWDSPAPARAKVRSAGATRSGIFRHAGFPSHASNLWGDTCSPSDGQAAGRRPSTAPAVGGQAVGQATRRSRSPGGLSSGGARRPLVGGREGDQRRLPGLSRSTSPSAPSVHARSGSTSIFFGPRGKEDNAGFNHARRQPNFVPVRALLLLSDWSIGHEVSAVVVSPFDSVSFLRAAIQADITKTTTVNNAGHRHGHRGPHGCPLFAFFYADGVAIDRGQEERLSVADIAIQSSRPACTVNDDPQWEMGNEGGGSVQKEMHVFLRAGEPRTKYATTDDGAGVLHRWESLQGGSSGNEVFLKAPSSGSPDSSSSAFFDSYGSQRGDNGYGFSSPHGGGVPLGAGTSSVGSSSLMTGGAHQHQPRQHQAKRFSVSFDESKAKRRRRIQEQVVLLAASKVTLITKVFRGYRVRLLFKERLEQHRGASKIQMCMRRKAAKQELNRRARRREKAVKIQSLARSRKSKRQASLRREQRAAATRIQSSARSKAAKKALKRRQEQRWREEELAREKEMQAEGQMRAQEHAERARAAREEMERMARLGEEETREKEEGAIVRIQSFARLRVAKKEAAGRRERKKVALLKQEEEQQQAALKLQRLSRVRAAKIEAGERRKRKEAAKLIQLKARQRAAKTRAQERREALKLVQQRKAEVQRQAVVKIQAAAKGKRDRARVRDFKSRRQDASTKISALARGRRARRKVSETKHKYNAAIVIQRTARGRRGRKRAETRADQQHVARRENNAAIKIQKVARGNSKRARFGQSTKDYNDRDLYGTKSGARECGVSVGAVPLDTGSGLPREQQRGSSHSLQRAGGPKRVGFEGKPSAEEAVALVALDLDQRVRSFVAVQATVRRCEAKVEEAAASRTAPARSEKNDTDDHSENGANIGPDAPSSIEIENETEREQENLSESDFAMSLSLSESVGQDTREGEQDEGWKSDFALDDTSGDVLAIPEGEQEEGWKSHFALDDTSGEPKNGMDKPHEDNDKLPESLPKGRKEGFKLDSNLDGESKGNLAVLEGVQRGEGEEFEDQATLSGRGSEDDGAWVIAGELAEVAVWEAKVALFLESRAESTQEASVTSDVAESLESAHVMDPDDAQSTAGDALIDGGPVPAAEALAEGGAAVVTADPDAVGETNSSDVTPMSAEVARVDPEQPVEGANELTVNETSPAEEDIATPAVIIDPAASLQSTKVAEVGELHQVAGDALIDAGPETEAAPSALVECDVVEPMADLDAAEEANAGEAVPMAAESTGVDADQPAAAAANEPGSSDTAPADAGTEYIVATAGSTETAQVVEPGELHPTTGDALVDAGPETETEHPAPTAEGGEITLAVDPGAAKGANPAEAIPTAAGSLEADAEQPVVDAANELTVDETTPAVSGTAGLAASIDPATSSENVRVADHGDVQPTARDALVEPGPQASTEQPVPVAEALVEGCVAAPAADPDAVGENSINDVMPMPAESAGVDDKQPAVAPASEPVSGDTTPADVSTDTAGSTQTVQVVEPGETQPTAGDALVDSALEMEAEHPAPAAEALAEGDAAMPVADPKTTKEGVNAVNATPTSAESAGVDAEYPAVEAANEPGSDEIAPSATNTPTPDVGIDPAAPLESTKVAELDQVQPAAGDALIDAGPETETEQPGPTEDALAGGDGAVPAVDPGAAEGARAGKAIPTAVVSAGADTEQTVVEAANELTVDGTSPVKADTTSPVVIIDPAASLESTKVAELGSVQSAAGDVLLDGGSETESEQLVPTADAVIHGDGRVPAVDPDFAQEGANAGKAISAASKSAEVDAEQPVVGETNELGSDETTSAEADTTIPAVSIDPAASLEDTKVTELGDVQPTSDALVDAVPQTETEQPVPAAEALAEGGAVQAADPDAVKDEANAAESIPTPAGSTGVDTPQRAVTADGDKGLAEADTVIAGLSSDGAGSLDSAQIVEPDEIQPTAGGVIVNAGPESEAEQPVLIAEALAKDGAAVPEANQDASGETSTSDVMPTSAESVGADTERPAVEAPTDLGAGDTAPAETKIESAVLSTDTPGSLENAQEVELGDVHPTAGDALIDAGPETESEQPGPSAEALVEKNAAVPVADPDAVGEARTSDVMPTSGEAARIDPEQRPVEAVTEHTVCDTAGSFESAHEAGPSELHPTAGEALIDAGRETEAAPSAEALADDGAAVPVVDPDTVQQEANPGEAIPTCAESATVDIAQPAVEETNEPGSGETAPAEADTTTPAVRTDPAASLESTEVAELVDAGPGTEPEPEQPVPADDALVDGDGVVPVADPAVVKEGENATKSSSMAAGPTGLDVDQPIKTADGGKAQAEVTTVLAVPSDAAGSMESAQVAEPDEVQPTADDALVDIGPKTDPEQPGPAVKTPAEGDGVVATSNPDAAGDASAAEPNALGTDSTRASAEQVVVEAANEPGSGDTAPVEADTMPPASSIDLATSLESGNFVDVGELIEVDQAAATPEDPSANAVVTDTVGSPIEHSVADAAGDALIDADPEPEGEQPVPAAEAMVENDAAVPAVDPDAVGAANASVVIPASAEAVGVDVKPPVDQPGKELDSGDTPPAVANTTTPAVSVDPVESLESTKAAALGDVQAAAGDAEIEAGPVPEPEQSVPAAEAAAHGGAAVPAADADTTEKPNAGEPIPTAQGSEGVADQPAVEAANELGSGDTAPAEADTTASASNVDLATSLESGRVVEVEETQPPSVGVGEMAMADPAAATPEDPSANAVVTDTAGSPMQQIIEGAAGIVPIGAGPETAERPIPAAEALVNGDLAVPVADPDVAREEANAGEEVPTAAESTGLDAEQPVAEAANEPGSGDTAPADARTHSIFADIDTAGSIETVQDMGPGETQPTAGDALVDSGPEAGAEQPAPTAEPLAKGDGVVLATDPGAAEGANAAEAIPMTHVSAGADAGQPAVEAANEPGSGETAPAEADSGLETAADPDAVKEGEESAESIPKPVESTRVDAPKRAVTADVDEDLAEAEVVIAALSSDSAGSLESTQVAEPGDTQPTAGDVIIHAGPEIAIEQPVLQATTEVGGDALTATDPDTVGAANDAEAIPTSTESAEVVAEQPAVQKANGPGAGETAPAVADTTIPPVSFDPDASLESAKLPDLHDVKAPPGDAIADAGPESDAEQLVPAAEAPAEGDGVVTTSDPDANGDARAGDAVPTSAESAQVSAEQSTVEVANELGSGDTAPAEADTMTSPSNNELDTSLDNGKVVELGDTQPPSVGVDVDPAAETPEAPPVIAVVTDTAGSPMQQIIEGARGIVSIGAGPETAERPVPAAEAVVNGDLAVPVADPDVAREEANAGEEVPTAAESTGLDAEQHATEAANEPGSGDTAPADVSTHCIVANVDTAESFETAQDMGPVGTQPTAGDALVDVGPETETEQPTPAAESDKVMPVADPGATEGANAVEAIPTANVSAGTDAEQPAAGAANEPGNDETAPAEADSGLETEAGPEQPVLAAEALAAGNGLVPAADLDAVKEGEESAESIPTPAESTGVDAPKRAVTADVDEDLAEAEVVITALSSDVAGSLESTQVAEPGDTQPTAGDVTIQAGPEIAIEQPVLQATTEVGGDALTATDPDTVGAANDAEAIPTSTESAEVVAEQPAVQKANGPGAGETAPAVADTTIPPVSFDPDASLESAKLPDLHDVKAPPGDAIADAGPESDAEQLVPAAEAPAEGDGVVTTSDPDANGDARAGDAVPTSAESAQVSAEQSTVEVANELGSGDTAPAEADTMTSPSNNELDTSLDNGKVVELGDAQPPSVGVDVDPAAETPEAPPASAVVTDTAGLPMQQIIEGARGIVSIGAGPETAERPVPAAEAVVNGDLAVPVADPDVAREEANAGEEVPTAAESTGLDAEQHATEAANEPGSGDTAPADAGTEPTFADVDTAGSTETARVVGPVGTQPTAGDALVDVGPETETEQPTPAAESDEVMPVADPGATEGPNVGKVIPTANVSAGADAEQPAAEAANELAVDETTPTVTDTTAPAASVDPASSLETNKVTDHGDVQAATDNALVDAGPQAEIEQPVPVAEALVEGSAAVPAADPDAVGESGINDVMPGVDAKRPAAEAANEIGGDTAPADTSTDSIVAHIDAAGSTETAQHMGPGETQPTAGDALVDSGPEAEAEQPAPMAETLAEGDGGVLATDPGAAEGANAAEAIPTTHVSAGADAEQPAVEAANEPGNSDTAPAETDTTTPAVSIDTPESLESTKLAELGDVQPIDAGPETETEQPTPAAESDEVMPAADPGATEGANDAEAIPTSAESLGVDAEQPAAEAANELAVDATNPAVADTAATPATSIDPASYLEITKVADHGDVQAATGDALVDAGQRAETEQPVPVAEALVEGSTAVPAADPDAVGESGINDVMPGVDAERPVAEAANEPASGDMASADASTENIVTHIDTAGSTETAQHMGPGETQPTAGDALVDSGPEAEAEQPAPTAETLAEGDGVVLATDPGLAEGADAAEAIPTTHVSAGADAEQPAVEAANEPGSSDTAPIETDTTTPAVSIDTPESLESAKLAELGDVQPIDAGPETETEQPAPAAESDDVMPAAGPGATEGANDAEAIPTSAESLGVDAEQPAAEAANELAVDETNPAVADTAATAATSIDPASYLEITKVADHGDVQAATGGALADAGPQAEIEQPVPVAEALVEGSTAVPAADPNAVGESSINDVMPGVDAERPVAEAANGPASGDTAPADASTENIVTHIETAGSTETAQHMGPGETQPTAGDALVDSGPEAEAEQPAPTAETLAEGDGVVLAMDPGAAEGADAAEAIPTTHVSAGADAEQPAVEAANEPGSSDTAPIETDTTTPAVSIDTPESLESAKLAELDDVQPIDAGPETETEQPAPAAESDDVMPAADPGNTEGANDTEAIPTSAESLGVDAEQPAAEAANELAVDETNPAVADTAATAATSIDPASYLETTKVADHGDVHAATVDALVDAGSRAETEQPVPVAETLVEGSAAVPAADPDAVGESSINAVMRTPAESGVVDAERPVAEAANEIGDETAPADPSTGSMVANVDTAGSTETQVVEPGETRPTVGDSLVDTGPETNAERPAPAAEPLAEGDANELGIGDAAPAEADATRSVTNPDTGGSSEGAKLADLDDVQAATDDAIADAGPEIDPEQSVSAAQAPAEGNGASAGDAVPTSAESARVSAEHAAVEAANDLASGDMAPAKMNITTPALRNDTGGSLDAANAVKPEEIQPTSVVVGEST